MSLMKKLDEIRARCTEHKALFDHPPPFAPGATVKKHKEFIEHARTDLLELEEVLREAYLLIVVAGPVLHQNDLFDIAKVCRKWLEKYNEPDTGGE